MHSTLPDLLLKPLCESSDVGSNGYGMVCQLWQRISALEEMLRNVQCMLSSVTETAGANVTNCVNQTPEFRVPHPVASSDDAESNHQYATTRSGRCNTSCSCIELLSKSVASVDNGAAVRGKIAASNVCKAIGNGNRTAPVASPSSKRKKFTED